MILVIDNYDSFTYNLVQMLALAGAEVEVRRNDAIDIDGFDALAPDGLVVSPGPSHPDAIPRVAALVRHALGINDAGVTLGDPRCPVLGVCLGHQLLGRVFGAEVRRAPEVVHGRASRIVHDGRGVFRDLPSPVAVGRYHSLAIVEETLSRDVTITARTEDGVIMGVRHDRLPAEGVQFHPESILTPEGATMLANFAEGCRTASSRGRRAGDLLSGERGRSLGGDGRSLAALGMTGESSALGMTGEGSAPGMTGEGSALGMTVEGSALGMTGESSALGMTGGGAS